MQEILFRGKTEADGRWVEGFYTKSPSGNTYIMETVCGAASPKVVDPETVGQCIGAKDKNGKRIFTDDIVRIDRERNLYVIKKWAWGFRAESRNRIFYFNTEINMEVIGNIHDNSELLKGGVGE